jgi:hypothetical protein
MWAITTSQSRDIGRPRTQRARRTVSVALQGSEAREGGRRLATTLWYSVGHMQKNWLYTILAVGGIILAAMLAYSILGWTGMR